MHVRQSGGDYGRAQSALTERAARCGSEAWLPATVLANRRGLHLVRAQGASELGGEDVWVAPEQLQMAGGGGGSGGGGGGGGGEVRYEVGDCVEALYVGGHDPRYPAAAPGWWRARVTAAAPAWHVVFEDGSHEVVMEGWVRGGRAPGEACEAVWKQGKDTASFPEASARCWFEGTVRAAFPRVYALRFDEGGSELFAVPAASMRSVG